MSGKLDRLKGLEGSKTTSKEKPVKLDGLDQLVAELRAMNLAQKQSQESLVNSLNQLSKVVVMAGDDGVSTDSIVEAINGLKDKLAEKVAPKLPSDYVITFERDKYALMKSGIRLTSVPRKLN